MVFRRVLTIGSRLTQRSDSLYITRIAAEARWNLRVASEGGTAGVPRSGDRPMQWGRSRISEESVGGGRETVRPLPDTEGLSDQRRKP